MSGRAVKWVSPAVPCLYKTSSQGMRCFFIRLGDLSELSSHASFYRAVHNECVGHREVFESLLFGILRRNQSLQAKRHNEP